MAIETTCGQVLCGKAKEEWLKTFLELANAIPSHDTFGRIFSELDPEMLEQFQASIEAIAFINPLNHSSA